MLEPGLESTAPPLLAILPTLALLAGCTTTDAAAPGSPGSADCDTDAVQDFVGRTATAEIGAQLLDASGARTLRWAPPDSALTMDFRPDRLTVSYDDVMTITEATCG